MLKRTRDLSTADYLSIAANFLPVIGVWVWDWSPQAVFLVYCLETILIGIFTLIKMAIVTLVRRSDNWYTDKGISKQPGIIFMIFFLLHYGIFVGIQMGIFFGVSGMGKEYNLSAFSFFYKWPQLLNQDTLIMLGIFFIGYAYRLIVDFIIPRQYKTISLMRLMFQPYGRIFVQQFTVILGSIFLTFGVGKIFILIFAIVKIFFETFVRFEDILEKGMKEMEKKSGQQ